MTLGSGSRLGLCPSSGGEYWRDVRNLGELSQRSPLTQVWNANHTVVTTDAVLGTSTIEFTGVTWNQLLEPGATAGFGFCAEKTLVDDGGGEDPDPPVSEVEVEWTANVGSDWNAGFCHTVTVTSVSDAAGFWTVTLQTPGPLNTVWDATSSPVIDAEQPNTYAFSGLPYNGLIEVGASVTFGYCGTNGGFVPRVEPGSRINAFFCGV